MYDCQIFYRPLIDFDFLRIAQEALGRSLAAKADKTGRKLSPEEKLISCVASLISEETEPGFHPQLLDIVTVGVIVAIDEEGYLELMNHVLGMRHVFTEARRGIFFGAIIGTLDQWKNAIISGSNSDIPEMQGLACKLYSQFEAAGLRLWTDYVPKRSGNCFRLEHK